MVLIKIFFSIVDILLVAIIMWFMNGERDSVSKFGFWTMIIAYTSSMLLMWM